MRSVDGAPERSGSSTLECVTEAMSIAKTLKVLAKSLIRVPEIRAPARASPPETFLSNMRRVAALENQAHASWRGRIFFELLDVAVFNLLHEGFALKEVALEIGGELAGDDEKLVVGHFGNRDVAARGNEM